MHQNYFLAPTISSNKIFFPVVMQKNGGEWWWWWLGGENVEASEEKFFCLMKKCANGCHFISFVNSRKKGNAEEEVKKTKEWKFCLFQKKNKWSDSNLKDTKNEWCENKARLAKHLRCGDVPTTKLIDPYEPIVIFYLALLFYLLPFPNALTPNNFRMAGYLKKHFVFFPLGLIFPEVRFEPGMVGCKALTLPLC